MLTIIIQPFLTTCQRIFENFSKKIKFFGIFNHLRPKFTFFRKIFLRTFVRIAFDWLFRHYRGRKFEKFLGLFALLKACSTDRRCPRSRRRLYNDKNPLRISLYKYNVYSQARRRWVFPLEDKKHNRTSNRLRVFRSPLLKRRRQTFLILPLALN